MLLMVLLPVASYFRTSEQFKFFKYLSYLLRYDFMYVKNLGKKCENAQVENNFKVVFSRYCLPDFCRMLFFVKNSTVC
jgi:hypothetical protein